MKQQYKVLLLQLMAKEFGSFIIIFCENIFNIENML